MGILWTQGENIPSHQPPVVLSRRRRIWRWFRSLLVAVGQSHAAFPWYP